MAKYREKQRLLIGVTRNDTGTDCVTNEKVTQQTQDLDNKTQDTRKQALHVTTFESIYEQVHKSKPSYTSSQWSSIGRLYKTLSKDNFVAAVSGWADAKQPDGVPHPLNYLLHDQEQYIARWRAGAEERKQREVVAQREREWYAQFDKDEK